MALATAEGVELSMMRGLTESESMYVDRLLERAELLIKARVPDLTARAEADDTFRELVAAIESEAVARVFRNPNAYRQETEGNYSYTLNYEVASGLLDILGREWERLGQGGYGALGPATDGYVRGRAGCAPDRQFQHCWPAYSSHSYGGEFFL